MSKRTNFRSSKKAGGFTLVEFGIVAALLAIAAMGIYALYADKRESSNAAAEAQSFTMMAADAQQKFRVQSSYTGTTAQTLIGNGIVPSSMVNGSNIITRWNNNVTITTANLHGTADGLTFNYTVPQKVCSDFVTQAQEAATRVLVRGTNVKDIGEPLTLAKVDAGCGTGSAPVSVALTIGK